MAAAAASATLRSRCLCAVRAATEANRRPSAIAVHQRESVVHRAAAVGPTVRQGLTSDRMWRGESSASPKRASDHAMADAEYNRRVSSSAGPTVVTALQATQRYRRT